MSEWLGPWIGVDLDRTLAHYDKWKGAGHIGEPIPLMADRVRQWLAAGTEVRIFTARVANPLNELERDLEILEFRLALNAWCLRHFGKILPVTCSKDMGCVEIWDDRAVQIEPNTGVRVEAYKQAYSELRH